MRFEMYSTLFVCVLLCVQNVLRFFAVWSESCFVSMCSECAVRRLLGIQNCYMCVLVCNQIIVCVFFA